MQRDLHAGPGGFYFVVRRMTIDWLRPAVMDDEIVVETSVSDVRGASMVMHQSVMRGGEMLVIGEVMVVGVRDGKPARLPAEVRSALTAAIPAGQDQTGQDRTGHDQNGSGPLPE
jgi:acyl-CoA thioester hydrolase